MAFPGFGSKSKPKPRKIGLGHWAEPPMNRSSWEHVANELGHGGLLGPTKWNATTQVKLMAVVAHWEVAQGGDATMLRGQTTPTCYWLATNAQVSIYVLWEANRGSGTARATAANSKEEMAHGGSAIEATRSHHLAYLACGDEKHHMTPRKGEGAYQRLSKEDGAWWQHCTDNEEQGAPAALVLKLEEEREHQ